MDIRDHIRTIENFPKPGILFYDISTLLAHPQAWRHTVDLLAVAIRQHQPDLLVGIESRGFLVAAPLALQLGCGFIMARKKDKLPGPTISHTYDLEYGTDTIEIQSDAVAADTRVVIIDDLLATGGTTAATIALLRSVGADVRAAAFIIELNGLGGRDKLDVPLTVLINFDA
ncbi:MAG: adenine phosphoribosyltransferase [Alphaproteobacteria bacterium]|nr:adenine phosphoribosyltransferase [Alphaproteobacteria bacterium]MCZ6838180.1 adenine phosphoribosyltransferase [Alphaproteobacteria bacterium]